MTREYKRGRGCDGAPASRVTTGEGRLLVTKELGCERDGLVIFSSPSSSIPYFMFLEEKREGKDPKRGATSVAGEGCVGHRRGRRRSPAAVTISTVAVVGPRLSQSKIREERGGQKPPLRGPTPPPRSADSLVPGGRPAEASLTS
ncbi:hypothetical protein Sjap_002274 [Stephania japonica]|uniref:Uncharacterized protein n=1 Tax=Stephania japonica TaxID=461633 RepID=A0AAP0PUE0_9MAGN